MLARPLQRVLLAAAGSMALLGMVAWWLGGVHLGLGPVRISAEDPSQVFLEAAVVWVAALVIWRPRNTPPVRLLVPLLAVLVAGIADSVPRRIGDGAEYLAMAVNMSHGRPPALTEAERSAVADALRTTPALTFSGEPVVVAGRDGRSEFVHFWLYPLLATPFVTLASFARLNIGYGFTAVNLLLFAGLTWLLLRRAEADTAILVVVGPLLWWVDKAHTEVFLFTLIAVAFLVLEERPVVSLVAAAIAAAQNPAAAVVLAVVAAHASIYRWRERRVRVALVCAAGIAAVAPVYYFWRLGVWSPLPATVETGVPGLRAVITPLIDPNLGLIVYAPVPLLLAAVGVWRGLRIPDSKSQTPNPKSQTPNPKSQIPSPKSPIPSPKSQAPNPKSQGTRGVSVAIGVAVAGLLVAFAQTPNVNHGGTPGMSRYALWLLAAITPLVAKGAATARLRHPAWLTAGILASMVMSIVGFRPALADRAGGSPSWLATEIWTRWPGLDNPLPEVFAERAYGLDGSPDVPVATAGCEKILIRGDGGDASWPIPCVPRAIPEFCATAGALCYVNGEEFAAVPWQPAFRPGVRPAYAWSTGTTERFAALLEPLGRDVRIVRVSEPHGRIIGGAVVRYVVEGSRGAAAWVTGGIAPGEVSRLRVRLVVPSLVEFRDPATLVVHAQAALSVGEHDVDVPREGETIVVVHDATPASRSVKAGSPGC